ncbi:TcfC E-set like domain-containing protein [Aeromonas enteropelogenes]|uniref:TcfC E-set like domain-containing protein n=1 Tax=Aeromonas enteropelogenes TaxID=29489 RepID=UPI003B9E7541
MRNIYFTVTMLCSSLGVAADYPVEFSDFFTKQQHAVFVRLAGDSVGLKVEARVSFDDVQLLDAAITPLRRYLMDKGVSSRGIDTITNTLTQGVLANPGCKVNLDVCVPDMADKKVQYVFDYDKSNLVIFIDSEWLTRVAEEINYHPAQRKSNALVNQSRVYGYADESSGGAVSLSNLTTIGLPYGYALFNTQYQSADNSLDIYKGIYDLEVDGLRAVLGYSERDQVSFNTTDFLNENADYTSYSLQAGSSRNLIRGGTEHLQSIYFFASQGGQLEVYQGDRLLLTKTVAQGRQSIAYADLPVGAYNVRLVLRAGSQIVLDELRQVVNSQQFNLPIGSWDYVLTAGHFDEVPEQHELQWLSSPTNFSKNYSQFRASWRLVDNVLLAGGITANQSERYAQAGISYAWSDWLQATYQAGLFSSGDEYQAGTLALGPLFLSSRHFKSDEKNRVYRLASQLYGENSYSNYSANYSAALWGGSGYLTYTHYKSDSAHSLYDVRSSKVDDISAGWTTSWKGWQLGANTTYSQNESYDELKFGVTASRPLGGDTTAQLSLMTDKNGISRSEAGITKSVSGDDWNGSGTASLAWQRDLSTPTEAILSGNMNGRTDSFGVSAYGYVNSDERRMISGTLTGTQFISAQGAGMTPDMGSSFMHVVPELANVPDSSSEISLEGVSYNVRRDTKGVYQGRLVEGDSIIPLTPYTDTELVIDAESRRLHIDNNIRREFVYPGTIYTVDARVTPVITQLFVLSDIQGNPIRHVRCVGDACVGVEPLSDDGVFRVTYRTGGNFSLISMNRVCINEPTLTRDIAISTYCLPGLLPKDGLMELSSDEQTQSNDLMYLGKYESSQQVQTVIDKLKDAGLTAKSITVGRYLYLYAKTRRELNMAQRAILEELDIYAVFNDANLDHLFSIR